MSNYINIFGGAAKDASLSPVVASAWEEEYNSIAESISSKANSIVGGTEDNLLKLDAEGSVEDVAVSADNIVGVTTNVQSSLDLLVPDTAPAAQNTSMTKVGNHIIFNTKNNSNTDSLTVLDQATFYTMGPVGSGADIEDADWADYYMVGADCIAGWMNVNFTIKNTFSTAVSVYMTSSDIVSPTVDDRNLIAEITASGLAGNASKAFRTQQQQYFMCPVGADGKVKITWKAGLGGQSLENYAMYPTMSIKA